MCENFKVKCAKSDAFSILALIVLNKLVAVAQVIATQDFWLLTIFMIMLFLY